MSKKNVISYDGKSFIINGKRVFINSGEMHYFRIPLSQWHDRLLKAKRAFVNCLGVYIAWNWHEKREGEFYFESDRDLENWIKLAEDSGLYIIARPGPYICSEWDFGGFPNWLIPKDCEMRSLESSFIGYCAKYLDKVNEIVIPHLITKGGRIILYQIENEFEVGDLAYHLKLKEMVEEDGIDVPILTNDNLWVRGSEIIETQDPYLRSWDISSPMNRVRDLIRTQPGKPAFGMEVGSNMYIRFGGLLPFSDGYRPPEMDEVYLKSLIAAGISGFNYYMYHGGTNLGYWTARDVTTTYDFEASIREWGELGSRYYIGRRLGGFLDCFGEMLLETTLVEGYCQVKEKGVETFVRKNKEITFIFLSNIYAQSRTFKMALKDPRAKESILLPQKGTYQLPSYSMAIVSVNLKLSDDYILLYSTSEIFHFINNETDKTLILYRDSGLEGETALKAKNKNVKVEGIEDYRTKKGILYLNYTHQIFPQFITIKGKEELKIIVLDKETASKTWFFNYQKKKYPLISNVYFLGEEKEDGKSLNLTFQVKEGKNWIKIPVKPKGIRLDGERIDFHCDEEKKIIELTLPEVIMPRIKYELDGRWKVKEDDLEARSNYDDKGWLDWQLPRSLESYGFLNNGYAWYRTHFKIQELKKPLYLDLTGFQDEAIVYLNGQYLATGRDCLKCEIFSLVRKGNNALSILVESLGHHCLGEKSFNGITCPVYISSEEKEIRLKEWKRKLLSQTYPEKALIKEMQPETKSEFDDENWEKVKVDWNWDSRFFKHPYEECFAWYRTRVAIPSTFKRSYLSLDFGPGLQDKIYLYLNGKFVGLRENTHVTTPFSFNITGKLEIGKRNILVIGIKAGRWVNLFGLHGVVKISTHELCLNKGWQVKEGLSGQNRGYFQMEYNDSDWEEMAIPEKKKSFPGSLIWYRKRIKIKNYNSFVAPLRLTIRNSTSKCLIYFNGVLIGRYADIGPQEDFYIYEDLIKEENLVAILVDGRKKGARLGEVSISPYYIAKRINLELLF